MALHRNEGLQPVTEELWLHLQRHFTCTQRTEHLAMKQFLFKITELEIWLVCTKTGSGFVHPLLTRCLNICLVSDFPANRVVAITSGKHMTKHFCVAKKYCGQCQLNRSHGV